MIGTTDRKHEACGMARSERVYFANVSGWVVATRHSPRNTALTHLSVS